MGGKSKASPEFSWRLGPHDPVKMTGAGPYVDSWRPEPGDAESMCGIPAKKSRDPPFDRLDNGLLIDVLGIQIFYS
jgi:hypothetical protein